MTTAQSKSNNNTKVSLAVVQTDISYIKEKQKEQSEGIKNILSILTEGEGKISALKVCNAETKAYLKVDSKRISRLEKVALGTVGALLLSLLGVAVSYIF